MEDQNKVNDIILHYENYINDVLKEDLKKLEFNLIRVNSEITEFNQIKQSLKVICDKNTFSDGFKTQVDVGCNFFIEAKVNDTSKMLFDIGLHHFLELSYEEANKFIDLRLNALENIAIALKQKAAENKAHIKLMLFGIGQLQNTSYHNDQNVVE